MWLTPLIQFLGKLKKVGCFRLQVCCVFQWVVCQPRLLFVLFFYFLLFIQKKMSVTWWRGQGRDNPPHSSTATESGMLYPESREWESCPCQSLASALTRATLCERYGPTLHQTYGIVGQGVMPSLVSHISPPVMGGRPDLVVMRVKYLARA